MRRQFSGSHLSLVVAVVVAVLLVIVGVAFAKDHDKSINSQMFSQVATGQKDNQTEEVAPAVKTKKLGPSAKHYPHPDVWGAELPTETGFIGKTSGSHGVFDNTEYFFDDSGRLLIFYTVETDDAIIHRICDFFARGVSDEWMISKRSKLFSEYGVLVFQRNDTGANPYRGKSFSYLRNRDADDYTNPVRIEFSLSREEEEINEKNKSLLHLLRESRKRREHDVNIREHGITRHDLQHLELVAECHDTVGVTYNSYYSCNFSKIMLVRVFSEPQVLDKRSFDWFYLNFEGKNEYEGKIFYRGKTIQDLNISRNVFKLGDGTYLIKDYGLPTVIRFYGCLESPYFEERDDLFRITEDDIRDAFEDFKYCSSLSYDGFPVRCNLSVEHPRHLLNIARGKCDAAGIFCKENEELSYRIKLLEYLDSLVVDKIVQHIRKKRSLGNAISEGGDKK